METKPMNRKSNTRGPGQDTRSKTAIAHCTTAAQHTPTPPEKGQTMGVGVGVAKGPDWACSTGQATGPSLEGIPAPN
ncbi:hypothetical protein PG991_004804 [Apiospora marii]|uniref:Uncharacterized protein n=1 Tax=Apiospora marii TaxID=335849 RepID=A0ABR1S8S9_9PEZI